MKRLLLLLPTSGYRAEPFVEAAARLDIALTIASEEPSSLGAHNPAGLLTLDFSDARHAARQSLAFHQDHPIDAVVGVDDATVLLQANIAAAIGLPSNPPAAVATARNKLQMRMALRDAGLPGPSFRSVTLEDDSAEVAHDIPYPCVVKPLSLSGSRGVIRADTPAEFIEAFHRLARLLHAPELLTLLGEDANHILVESYVPGMEVALEGLLLSGELRVLALFDKPDPLDGPFFEESIYVTPSGLPQETQAAIAEAVARGAKALGLNEGPIHAELRVGPTGPTLLEIHPRSIGGRCSKMLRFGVNLSLEEIILRRALRMEIPSLDREEDASGVMMIPTSGEGILRDFGGEEEALSVPGITEVSISAHRSQKLMPLPEGSGYTGFIFARGVTPEFVVEALREAHRRLWFDLEPCR